MLRISRLSQPPEAETLKLEGKLLAPWVDEVSAACRAACASQLDLADVTYVDAAGAKLLHELVREGVRIGACSGFVAALLAGEERR